ncbi:MAG: cupin domain-containing protein, partial [Desulfobacteraceae bacterium]|nr:cupin domain-containing protein [Desulfobacteraceae bacterium]
DEVFFIVDGKMKIEFKDNTVELNTGEMCVVPKGVEHRPICTSEVICLLIESEGTLTPENTGGTYKG